MSDFGENSHVGSKIVRFLWKWMVLAEISTKVILLLKKKGKQCVTFGCSNTFYGPNGLPSSLHFFKFPKDTEQKTPMVQSHQTSAWERWLFRDKFDGGLLKTLSKRRHTENFNRSLGISVRGIRSLRKCVSSQTVSSQTSLVDSQTHPSRFANVI